MLAESGFVYAACQNEHCKQYGRKKSYPTKLIVGHGIDAYVSIAPQCSSCNSFLPPTED